MPRKFSLRRASWPERQRPYLGAEVAGFRQVELDIGAERQRPVALDHRAAGRDVADADLELHPVPLDVGELEQRLAGRPVELEAVGADLLVLGGKGAGILVVHWTAEDI